MNTNNVVSAPAAADLTGKEYRVVKLTAAGIDICTSADTPIGTLHRAQPHQEDGTYAGKAVAVQLKAASVHFCTIGNSSAAVAKGAVLGLDAANPGMLIPGGTGTIAYAWDAFTAFTGAIVRVIFA
jgi:hypothetical protein